MDDDKMQLTPEEANRLEKPHQKAVEMLMNPKPKANVVGVGIGIKFTNGVPTGEPSLLILVSKKIPEEKLGKSDIIPIFIDSVPTDVVDIGGMPTANTLTRRIRPAEGGYSVGHKDITAGTIGTCVYDILPAGIGKPPKNYILSNNHVLANENNAAIGDPILQPGPFDGGVEPTDRIATLSKFIPITFEPPTPRDQHNNTVDAAIAEGLFQFLDREIYWTGYVAGWRPKANVTVGTLVKKTGRTTNLTFGQITAVNVTVDVLFSSGIARFNDQIMTTNMSAGGDSGSLLLTKNDNVAVGLLFAGSPSATFHNQIENVRNALQIEVADRIL